MSTREIPILHIPPAYLSEDACAEMRQTVELLHQYARELKEGSRSAIVLPEGFYLEWVEVKTCQRN